MTLGRLTPAEISARARANVQAALVRARDKLVSPAVVKRRIEARFGPGSAPETLPRHIAPYGNFMAQSAAKEPTRRDLVKAYAITRSSVNRGAVKKTALCPRFPEYAPLKRAAARGDLRPEDIFATLLFSPAGKRYLDAAERGHFDSEAAREITDRMHCFGMSNVLHDDLRRAVAEGAKVELVKRKLRGSPEEWIEHVKKDVWGVSAAKAGFLASLLGRGDIPTFDAREIKLWRHSEGRKAAEPKAADVLAYREEMQRYPMKLDPKFEPFREHLVHHALWTSYPEIGEKRVKTSHGALIRAMQFAGPKSLGSWSDDAEKAMKDNPRYFMQWYTTKSLGLVVAVAFAAYLYGKQSTATLPG